MSDQTAVNINPSHPATKVNTRPGQKRHRRLAGTTDRAHVSAITLCRRLDFCSTELVFVRPLWQLCGVGCRGHPFRPERGPAWALAAVAPATSLLLPLCPRRASFLIVSLLFCAVVGVQTASVCAPGVSGFSGPAMAAAGEFPVIREAPVYHPTAREFRDPLAYIEVGQTWHPEPGKAPQTPIYGLVGGFGCSSCSPSRQALLMIDHA